MSAYGTITVTGRQVTLLPSTTWELPEPANGKPAAPFRRLALHHLRLDSARALPSLLEHTYQVFAAEVEAGRTYPQEAAAKSQATASPSSESGANTTSGSGGGGGGGVVSDSEAMAGTATTTTTMTSESQCYYTRADFEAYFWAADVVVAIGINADDDHDGSDPALVGRGVEAARAGRRWEDVLVGFYYIKPNYPGRSSHVSDYGYIIVHERADGESI
jgi:hypothetical protein